MTNIREKLAEHGVPESCHGGIERYMLDRLRPGSFVQAVLENDFMNAFAQADHNNLHLLKSFASFLYNEMPDRTAADAPWGSKEKVEAWLATGQEAPRW